jgi:hypothetical protein
MPTVPTVREVRLGDHREEVIGLWRRSLPGASRGDPHLKLLRGYLDNPAGAGRGLLLLAGAENAAVGVICLHPRRLHLGDRAIEANNMADFAVDDNYRTLGPALMLMKGAVALASATAGLLYALPNRKSAPVCKRAGLRNLGTLVRYARVVSGRHPLIARWSRALQPLVAPPMTLALAVLDAARSLRLRPRLRGEPVGFDHPDIDALWARRPRQLLLGDRSSALLRWRFGDSGPSGWQPWLVRDTAGSAVGLLVWRLRDGMAELGDFFSADPAHQTAPMLHEFCRHARKVGAQSVSLEFFGTPAVIQEFARAGFKPRNEGIPVVLGVLPADLPEAGDELHWYLTGFDNDAS